MDAIERLAKLVARDAAAGLLDTQTLDMCRALLSGIASDVLDANVTATLTFTPDKKVA